MVKLHLLLDILQVIIFEEKGSPGMMGCEGSDVKDIILED
jgi:hypothetical protein